MWAAEAFQLSSCKLLRNLWGLNIVCNELLNTCNMSLT